MDTIKDDDGQLRCRWGTTAPDYIAYHDDEWGMPVDDDNRLFEKLCLEGFQSGLSWLTILRKRENFRRAFDDFDFDRLASEGDARIERLLDDAGIVRHRGKIESVLNNAGCAVELRREFGSLAAYFWAHEPPRGRFSGVPAKTDLSTRLSKDLKKRGFSYVGPTTVYAFLQAMGMVNDHVPGCFRRAKVEESRRAIAIPRSK